MIGLVEEITYFFENALFMWSIFGGQNLAKFLEKPALLAIQLLRYLHIDMDVEIAASAAVVFGSRANATVNPSARNGNVGIK